MTCVQSARPPAPKGDLCTSLQGQTILVTGATGAIGRAICRHLAAEGGRVLLHYGRNRSAAQTLLDEIGGNGAILAADLADPAAADLAKAAILHFRRHGAAGSSTSPAARASGAMCPMPWPMVHRRRR